MKEESKLRLVTADHQLEEVLMRYPTTALIFLQYGRMHIDQSDPVFHLFSTYPPMTVSEYAPLNCLDLEGLLRLLNAAAESEEYSKQFIKPGKR